MKWYLCIMLCYTSQGNFVQVFCQGRYTMTTNDIILISLYHKTWNSFLGVLSNKILHLLMTRLRETFCLCLNKESFSYTHIRLNATKQSYSWVIQIKHFIKGGSITFAKTWSLTFPTDCVIPTGLPNPIALTSGSCSVIQWNYHLRIHSFVTIPT